MISKMKNDSMFINSFRDDETCDAIYNHTIEQLSIHDIYENIESYFIIREFHEMNSFIECDDILTIDNIKKYTYQYVDEIAQKYNINRDEFEYHAHINHL